MRKTYSNEARDFAAMTKPVNRPTNRRQFLQKGTAILCAPTIASCGPDIQLVEDAPHSDFDEDSTAEEVTEGLNLKGKLAIVTGCTSGIGFETMRVLALRGAYVVGTSRSLQRAEQACKSVSGLTTPVAMELSDPVSVVECTEKIRTLNAPIDMLICNAGFYGGSGERELINGVEKHFAVNHLGHFIFVNRLLDRLYLAWQGRVVVVASRTSYTDVPEQGIEFGDLAFADGYTDSLAYGHSKLANVLYSLGLARRLKGTRITSNALHPGVINTGIDRNHSRSYQFGFGLFAKIGGKSIEQGAATSCYVASNPMLGSTSGEYFQDCNPVAVSGSFHEDVAMSDRLWDISEKLTADYIVTHQRPDPNDVRKDMRQKIEVPKP